jgi:hypothetical protein
MSPRLLFAYLVLSLIEPLLAFAKPPDLPVDLQAYYRNLALQQGQQQHQAPRPSPLLPPASDPTAEQVRELEGDAQEAQEAPEYACPCLDGCCVEFLEILSKIAEAMAGDQAEEAEAPESEVIEVMPKEKKPALEDGFYRVVEGGEHIVAIARERLGDGARWAEIYRLNPDLNPGTPIPAGTILRMPETEVIGKKVEQLSLSPRHAQAKHLYRVGERCRRQGDLDMARNCYEEVCRIAPKSSYSILASAQLVRMKGQANREPPARDAGETQEAPPARRSGNEEEQTLIEELRRMADQLRKQSHEEPTCPFRRGKGPACPNPRPDKPVKEDESMSDAEMQELLDDSQFLETYLDELVNPDDAEGDNSGAKPDRPEELTIAPAPQALTIVEEPQRTTDQSAARELRRLSVKQSGPSPRVKPPANLKP